MTEEKKLMTFVGIELTETPDSLLVGKLHDHTVEIVGWQPKHEGMVRAILTGPVMHVNVVGTTFREVEENFIMAIGEARDRMLDFCIKVQAPPSAISAIEEFVSRWGRLPPLVRAGTAEALIRDCALYAKTHRTREQEYQKVPALDRRRRVHRLFQRAAQVLQMFAIDLVAGADAEAELEGIDSDTRYTEDPPPRPIEKPSVVDLAKAIHGATGHDADRIIAGMSEQISKEQDDEIRRALADAAGVSERPIFKDALRDLVNCYSKENGSNTADDLLAQLMTGVLETYEKVVMERDRRAGR